jgi:asparagine synthase (glutamine-hydrolysing)
MLSGGLDSSSITCVARNILKDNGSAPLQTFSAVFDQVKECDERSFINTVINQGGIKPNFMVSDQLVPLGDFQSLVAQIDMPVFAPNLALHWHLYKAARGQGISVLLDGFDGDSVVSHGFQYLNELAASHRWFSLMRETRALYKNDGESPWLPLKQFVQHFGFKPLVSKSRLLRLLQRLSRSVTRRTGKAMDPQAAQANRLAILHADFVQRTGIEEKLKSWRKSQPSTALTEREGHYRTLTQDGLSLAFDLYHSATSAVGLEVRYPFWDKRVVEYCLALPPEQKLHRGLSRVVLRRAMAGILPGEIQRRPNKIDFFPLFQQGLRSAGVEKLNNIFLFNSENYASYINGNLIRELCTQILSDSSQSLPNDWLALWRVVSVVAWLNRPRPINALRKEVLVM